MKLTDEQKSLIEDEYRSFESKQYLGQDRKSRQQKSQFFTPPELTIKMIEKFDSISKDDKILDPTCGAGGLLVAMYFAGANPKNIYGIELDPAIAELCRDRLEKYGVPRDNIIVGDALEDATYEKFDL